MLSTGVDIPDLEFIVFLRPVKSRILFEQMLGRGTRKGEKYPDKSHFTVFDCFDGTLLEYFRNATAFTAEPPDQPARTIAEIIEDIWQNRDRDYNVRCLVKRLQRIDKEMSGEARELFAAFIPDGDVAQFAAALPAALASDFTGTMKLLRDPAFQDLLVNYPRPQRVFYVAYGTEDTVASEWLIRDADGKEYKPEDYLAAFARFVQRTPLTSGDPHPARPACGVEHGSSRRTPAQRHHSRALHRRQPAGRARAALPEGERRPDLDGEACGARQEPLFTAEERAARALESRRAGQALNEEQRAWFDRLQPVLAENLSLDRDDFEVVPALSRPGGWGRADRDFGGGLQLLVHRVNEAIAA